MRPVRDGVLHGGFDDPQLRTSPAAVAPANTYGNDAPGTAAAPAITDDNWVGMGQAQGAGSGSIYTGGSFFMSESNPSANFAIYRLDGSGAIASPNSPSSPPRLSFNPAIHLINISLSKAAAVDTRFFSLSGRTVYRDSRLLPAGNHTVGLNTKLLPRGLYVARVEAGNESIRCKVLIDR